MTTETERTIAQFVTEYAAAHPDENPATVKTKIYQWAASGHLPTRRTPNEHGILVTVADPAVFESPPLGGPEISPSGHGYKASTAARKLGISRQAVHRRLKKLEIDDAVVPFELFEEWMAARGK